MTNMKHARKIKTLFKMIFMHAPIAELVKLQPFKLEIEGSIPSGSTNCTFGRVGQATDF